MKKSYLVPQIESIKISSPNLMLTLSADTNKATSSDNVIFEGVARGWNSDDWSVDKNEE